MIVMLIAIQAATAPARAGPPSPARGRYERCVALIGADTPGAEREAEQWRTAGGGAPASQCLGLALASRTQYAPAATAFEAAARAAEADKGADAAAYWAQAGNAWLAAGEPVKAKAALDAALAAGTLVGLQRGEALLDRARAQVAANQTTAARIDIDAALIPAASDPLAWLLSATLARRMNDLPRAKKDIAEALRRSGDDASVQLEAGNIAAASGDEAGARIAWARAAEIAPDAPAGRSAALALKQFEAGNAAKVPAGR